MPSAALLSVMTCPLIHAASFVSPSPSASATPSATPFVAFVLFATWPGSSWAPSADVPTLPLPFVSWVSGSATPFPWVWFVSIVLRSAAPPSTLFDMGDCTCSCVARLASLCVSFAREARRNLSFRSPWAEIRVNSATKDWPQNALFSRLASAYFGGSRKTHTSYTSEHTCRAL